MFGLLDLQDEGNLEKRRDALEEGWNPPSPITLNDSSSKCDRCCNNSPYEIRRIKEGGHDGTLFRISKFSNHSGARNDAEHNSEA
jgi:hypothetical protein